MLLIADCQGERPQCGRKVQCPVHLPSGLKFCFLQMLREKRKAEERRKHAEEASKWREKSLKSKKGGRDSESRPTSKRYGPPRPRTD